MPERSESSKISKTLHVAQREGRVLTALRYLQCNAKQGRTCSAAFRSAEKGLPSAVQIVSSRDAAYDTFI
jgi:hypothetical protein